MFDVLETVLDAGDYVEVRFHEKRARGVLVESGVLERASSSVFAGVGIRVFHEGTWGFSSTTRTDATGLGDAARRARAAADAVRSVVTSPRTLALAAGTPAVGAFTSPAYAALGSAEFDARIALCLQTDRQVRESGGRVVSSSASYTEILDEKYIITSDGARVHLRDARPEFRVSAVAQMESQRQRATEAVGKAGDLLALFGHQSAEELAEKVAKTSTDLLRASPISGGQCRVILAPDLVGLLIHEAIGHAVEADFVLQGSAAAGRLGQRVASDLITLKDSGASPHDDHAAGSLAADDEGVMCAETTIIDNGVLKSYLHNKETAARFEVAPTGSARAFEFDDEPLIRMRNTFVVPGATGLDEMVGTLDDGVLLRGAENGEADANGEFMFVVSEAYPIKNGKIGALHRGTTIVGDAFDVLRSVDAVGDVFQWDLGSGYCYKGQRAKVDAGGPHVRCSVTLADNADDEGALR